MRVSEKNGGRSLLAMKGMHKRRKEGDGRGQEIKANVKSQCKKPM
jgi:hypothetical protein